MSTTRHLSARGIIATARARDGQHVTPAEGLALDAEHALESLEALMRERDSERPAER